MLTLGARLSERILSFPTPVLVACNGHAIAAGTFAALAADLRIGVDGPFKLGLNEVKIGLTVPLYVVELARQRLTPRDFNRSLVTAAMYSPAEAVAAGFLDRVVAAEELREVSLAAAEELAGLDMAAHAATKLRVRDSALKALREAIDSELSHRATPVNVLIAADMEGIAGIEDYGECLPSHPAAYARGRRLMTDEVAARRSRRCAPPGSRTSRSATGTWSAPTSNASGCPRVSRCGRSPTSPWSRPTPRSTKAAGGGELDAVVLIGHHAKTTSPRGFSSHTFIWEMEVELDGDPLSETQVFAQGLAAEGVPILAAAGDRGCSRSSTRASSAAPACWRPRRARGALGRDRSTPARPARRSPRRSARRWRRRAGRRRCAATRPS